MIEMKMYFLDLTDSRDNRGRRHELQNIIVMSIYAVFNVVTQMQKIWHFL